MAQKEETSPKESKTFIQERRAIFHKWNQEKNDVEMFEVDYQLGWGNM